MTKLHRTIYAAGLLAMLLYPRGCLVVEDEDSSDNNNPSTGTQPSFGTFLVSIIAPDGTTTGYTSVLGRMYDGPTPSAVVWEELAASGDCRLLVPRVPFCEQSCGSAAACVEDDSCQPYPTAISVGTVTVTGLRTTAGASTFSMEPVLNSYQPAGGIVVAYPPSSEGDTVTFAASGNPPVPAFSIAARGISPLEVLNDTIVLADGQPIDLQWTPPALPDITTISVVIDVSHHGGTKGKVECDCEDDGSLEVPATLLDQLKALGVSGFPKLEITRRAVGTDTTVHANLVIESKVTRYLEIPGLVSCNGDEDCPNGQTCQPDFRCQ